MDQQGCPNHIFSLTLNKADQARLAEPQRHQEQGLTGLSSKSLTVFQNSGAEGGNVVGAE